MGGTFVNDPNGNSGSEVNASGTRERFKEPLREQDSKKIYSQDVFQRDIEWFGEYVVVCEANLEKSQAIAIPNDAPEDLCGVKFRLMTNDKNNPQPVTGGAYSVDVTSLDGVTVTTENFPLVDVNGRMSVRFSPRCVTAITLYLTFAQETTVLMDAHGRRCYNQEAHIMDADIHVDTEFSYTREKFKEPIDPTDNQMIKAMDNMQRDFEPLDEQDATFTGGDTQVVEFSMPNDAPEHLCALLLRAYNSKDAPITQFVRYRLHITSLDGSVETVDDREGIFVNGRAYVKITPRLVTDVTMDVVNTSNEPFVGDATFQLSGQRAYNQHVGAPIDNPLFNKEVTDIAQADVVRNAANAQSFTSAIFDSNGFFAPIDKLLDGNCETYVNLFGGVDGQTYYISAVMKRPTVIDMIKITMPNIDGVSYPQVIPYNAQMALARITIGYADDTHIETIPIQQGKFIMAMPQRREINFVVVELQMNPQGQVDVSQLVLETNSKFIGSIHAAPEQTTDVAQLTFADFLVYNENDGMWSGVYNMSTANSIATLRPIVDGDRESESSVSLEAGDDPQDFAIVAYLKKPKILDEIKILGGTVGDARCRILNPISGQFIIYYVDSTIETVPYSTSAVIGAYCVPKRKQIDAVFAYITVPAGTTYVVHEFVCSTRGNPAGTQHARPANVTDIKELTNQDFGTEELNQLQSGIYNENQSLIATLDNLLDANLKTGVTLDNTLGQGTQVFQLTAYLSKPRIVDEIKLLANDQRDVDWLTMLSNTTDGTINIGYEDGSTESYRICESYRLYDVVPQRERRVKSILMLIPVAAGASITLGTLVVSVDTDINGRLHAHPEHVSDTEELGIEDMMKWAGGNFNDPATCLFNANLTKTYNIDNLMDGNAETYIPLPASDGPQPFVLYGYLKKPQMLEEIGLTNLVSDIVNSNWMIVDGTIITTASYTIKYADGQVESFEIAPQGRLRVVPQRKSVEYVFFAFTLGGAQTVTLGEFILRKRSGLIGKEMGHPTNVQETPFITKQDIITSYTNDQTLASYVFDVSNNHVYPIDPLLDARSDPYSAGIRLAPSSQYVIALRLKRPLMLDELKLVIRDEGQSFDAQQVMFVDGDPIVAPVNITVNYVEPYSQQVESIQSGSEVIMKFDRMREVWAITISFTTGNSPNVILTELLIRKGQDFNGRSEGTPSYTESVQELTFADLMISPAGGAGYASILVNQGATWIQSVEKLFDGMTSTWIPFAADSQGIGTRLNIYVAIEKPKILDEIKLLGMTTDPTQTTPTGKILGIEAGKVTSGTMVVYYSDGDTDTVPLSLEGDLFWTKPKMKEIYFIFIQMDITDATTVWLQQLVALIAPRVVSSEQQPVNSAEIGELVLEDIWSATEDGETFIPISRINKMFDKNPTTYYSLDPGHQLTLRFKKAFRLKEFEALDVNGQAITVGWLGENVEDTIAYDVETKIFVGDDEFSEITIENLSEIDPLLIYEVILKKFFDQRVFGQDWRIPVDDSVSVDDATTAVLAANPARKYAIFFNDSDATIYLSLGLAAVLNKGIRLNANGGNYEINNTNLYKGEVNAIASVAGKNLTYVEGS